jgi:hypothetical protein
MKKIYLLLFLCNSLFSVHAQNKKGLNASILRLQSDSTAMSNTIEEKERIISKNTNKIEELNSLNRSNSSEIDNLKKKITEKEKLLNNNEKLIAHKNIIIDSLTMNLGQINDSLLNINKTNSSNLKRLLSSNIQIVQGEFINSDGYDDDWWHEFKINNRTETIYQYVDADVKYFELLSNLPPLAENLWPETENGDCIGRCFGTIIYMNIKYKRYSQATEKDEIVSNPFLIYFIPD